MTNLAVWLPFLAAGGCVILGIAAVLRAKRSVADWSFVAGIVAGGAASFFLGWVSLQETAEGAFAWQKRTVAAEALLPGLWLTFSATFARGNARAFLRKWRHLLIAFVFGPPVVATSFYNSLLAAVGKDTASQWAFQLGWAGIVLNASVLIGAVLILTNLERTYRAAVGTMRWRIKFMLLGLAVVFVARLYSSSQAILFRVITNEAQMFNSAALLVACPLLFRSLLRSGQSDTQVYPSQAVLQSSLTILLAGVYLLVIGVLAKIVAYFGGAATLPVKAFIILVSLVLLAVLLQSDRFRLYLRHFVSRHFQRPLYDYRLAWQKFTAGTVSRVEQADLCRSLVRMVAEMFESLSVSIWVVDKKVESITLAASTSVSAAKAADIAPTEVERAEVARYFETHSAPVDIESSTSRWAVALRRWHPSEFPNGGKRVAVPLIGQGSVLGVLVVGDRISGVPFSLQDFDMLKCVADHTAASLLNVQLSQQLLQAKELEAFQTMAAFFVHDLKNAASTLNLMLKNMPVHFDDPAFREDALRGMSKTVSHINHLISRLGLLRHELKINAVESDLNDVINAAIGEIEQSSGHQFTKELRAAGKVLVDREQIQKVATNLVLNAAEATPAGGKIRVTTSQENGWAVFSVEDSGCGMTPEFVARSLFRPFQTTKKNGLGIGMFQSKMIVEAHGGRITVASEPGKGTSFQVFLRASVAK